MKIEQTCPRMTWPTDCCCCCCCCCGGGGGGPDWGVATRVEWFVGCSVWISFLLDTFERWEEYDSSNSLTFQTFSIVTLTNANGISLFILCSFSNNNWIMTYSNSIDIASPVLLLCNLSESGSLSLQMSLCISHCLSLGLHLSCSHLHLLLNLGWGQLVNRRQLTGRYGRRRRTRLVHRSKLLLIVLNEEIHRFQSWDGRKLNYNQTDVWVIYLQTRIIAVLPLGSSPFRRRENLHRVWRHRWPLEFVIVC